MSTTDQFMSPRGTAMNVPADFEPERGAGSVRRHAQRLMGAACVVGVVMLWVAPGAIWDPDIIAFKATLSVVMTFGGLFLLSAGRVDAGAPEVEVDLIRREVRVVRGTGSRKAVERRCQFQDLSRAEQTGQIVGLWDADGTHLTDVSMRNAAVSRPLASALRDTGKL